MQRKGGREGGRGEEGMEGCVRERYFRGLMVEMVGVWIDGEGAN